MKNSKTQKELCKKGIKFGIITTFLFVVVIGLVGVFYFIFTSTPAVDDFAKNAASGNYVGIYEDFSDELKNEQSATTIEALLKSQGINDKCEWTKTLQDKEKTEVHGVFECQDKEFYAVFKLNNGKIYSYNIAPLVN